MKERWLRAFRVLWSGLRFSVDTDLPPEETCARMRAQIDPGPRFFSLASYWRGTVEGDELALRYHGGGKSSVGVAGKVEAAPGGSRVKVEIHPSWRWFWMLWVAVSVIAPVAFAFEAIWFALAFFVCGAWGVAVFPFLAESSISRAEADFRRLVPNEHARVDVGDGAYRSARAESVAAQRDAPAKQKKRGDIFDPSEL